MRASIECHCATIRVHEADDGKFGDPYVWCCTATFTPDGKAWLGGFTNPVTPSIWKAIREILQTHGVEYVIWQRRKKGEATRTIRGSVITGKREL